MAIRNPYEAASRAGLRVWRVLADVKKAAPKKQKAAKKKSALMKK